MRRYTLNISDREFVVDVQEIDADNFEVVVGDDTYQVSLTGDESLNGAVITPGLAPNAAPAAAPARKAAAPRPAAAAPAIPPATEVARHAMFWAYWAPLALPCKSL